jgi:hypothetical protein
MLGVLFIIIGLKLSLGTAGIIPSLNIPGGLISFAAVKSMAAVGSSLQLHTRAPMAHRLLFQPFGLQENAVMQTFVLSMGTGGFGSYITGGCRDRRLWVSVVLSLLVRLLQFIYILKENGEIALAGPASAAAAAESGSSIFHSQQQQPSLAPGFHMGTCTCSFSQ